MEKYKRCKRRIEDYQQKAYKLQTDEKLVLEKQELMEKVYSDSEQEIWMKYNKMKIEIDETKHQIDHESTQIEIKESQIDIQQNLGGLEEELEALETEIEHLENEKNELNRSLTTKSVEFDHLQQTIISLKRSNWSRESGEKSKLNNSHEKDSNGEYLAYRPKEGYQTMEEVREEQEDREDGTDKGKGNVIIM